MFVGRLFLLVVIPMVSFSALASDTIPNIQNYVGLWKPVSCKGADLSPQKIEMIDEGKELLLTYVSKDMGEIRNLSTKPESIVKEHKLPGAWPKLKQVTDRQVVGNKIVSLQECQVF